MTAGMLENQDSMEVEVEGGQPTLGSTKKQEGSQDRLLNDPLMHFLGVNKAKEFIEKQEQRRGSG